MIPDRTLQKYKMTPSGRNSYSCLRVLLYSDLAYQKWKTAKITKSVCKIRLYGRVEFNFVNEEWEFCKKMKKTVDKCWDG